VHAAAAQERGDLIRLVANLDVPGWRFPFVNAAFANSDLAGWPDLRTLNRIPDRYPVGTEIIGVPAPFIENSNISPFWNNGYHGFTLGSLYALAPWMNTAEDTYNKLDVEQCANVARALVAYVGERAGVLGGSDDDSATDDTTDIPSPDDTAGDDDDGADDTVAEAPSDDDDNGCGC
jgi:hypothetical protein